MTEAEWLAATDPTPMLEALPGKASDRKFRLFACGYYRLIWHALNEQRNQRIVEICERYADGLVKRQALSGARHRGWNAAVTAAAWVVAEDSAWWAAKRTTENFHYRDVFPREVWQRDQCELLRDVFGNPFRPVAVDPSWLTSTVVCLAEGIYQDRAFDRLPILADALMDAGCDNDDVLSHCRSDGPHVRGCWVVDLLTGRK
jgi:hypothetical protein